MNLKEYIKNYKFNSLVKVIIGKAELVGLILQKEYVGPVFFYHANIYGIYTKYRMFEEFAGDITTFELLELNKIRDTDIDNHHHKWLSNTWKELRYVPCLDMRIIYKNKFVELIDED